LGLGAPGELLSAVDNPQAEVKQTDDTAAEATAAKDSAHGASGDQLASEA
jgi:hypothetical protein